MTVRFKPGSALLAVAALAGAALSTWAQAQQPCPTENRSGTCGYYASEISAARAFVDTVVLQGRWGNPAEQPVIIDVRSTSEYRAGHPDFAYNVPYPYIYQQCDANGRTADGACAKAKVSEIAQDNADFVAYVQSLVRSKDTPIYTLCRTGVRSVAAANLLTDAGFTNVHNIWEGFVGVNLMAPKKQPDGTTKSMPVDLDHNGVLNDADKNGWRYHMGLPYDTRLLPPLLYRPRLDLYNLPD